MKKNEAPIVVQQTFSVDQEVLWKSITEVEQMRQWFFDNIPAFEAKVGFKTQFNVHNEGRTFPHCWEIIEVIPLVKITYNWKYEGYAGDSTVAFELFPEMDSTTLRVTDTVVEDFPQNIPEFKRESGISGWNYFIKQSLLKYLT